MPPTRNQVPNAEQCSDVDFWSPASVVITPRYTVSAVDNHRMASWSNWDDPNGGDDVDVAALVCVLSYYQGGNLRHSPHTMAAPHVAGLLLMGNGKLEGDMVQANASAIAIHLP